MALMTRETDETTNVDLIDHALASRRWLTPLPKQLQARFRAGQLADRRRHNRIVLLLFAVMFDLFLVNEVKTAPDILALSAWLRLAVYTPLVVLFVGLDWCGRLNRLYGPCLAGLGALPTLLSAILVLQASPADVNGIADVASIPLILLATGLITRLTPGEVLANVLISVPCYVFTVASLKAAVPASQTGSFMFIGISVGICAVVFNWRLESRDRRVFLLQASDAINRAALAAHNRGLLAEIQTDGLTGVANRRCFDETLRAAWVAATASGSKIGLIIMDIDHFKSFNDFYGHQGGDDCLRMIATHASAEVRKSDLFARYGGEEFAVILPGAPLEAAVAAAERIRLAVEKLGLRHDGQGGGACVTLSLGAAVMAPRVADDPRRLIEMADASLYAAKRAGRNRVVARPDEPEADPNGTRILDFRRAAP